MLYHVFAERAGILISLCLALVLAPFFVHLELLFKFGYKPELRKDIHNGIGMEIAKIKKAEGDRKRAEAKEKDL